MAKRKIKVEKGVYTVPKLAVILGITPEGLRQKLDPEQGRPRNDGTIKQDVLQQYAEKHGGTWLITFEKDLTIELGR
jgi:hypothetical protein